MGALHFTLEVVGKKHLRFRGRVQRGGCGWGVRVLLKNRGVWLIQGPGGGWKGGGFTAAGAATLYGLLESQLQASVAEK